MLNYVVKEMLLADESKSDGSVWKDEDQTNSKEISPIAKQDFA